MQMFHFASMISKPYPLTAPPKKKQLFNYVLSCLAFFAFFRFALSISSLWASNWYKIYTFFHSTSFELRKQSKEMQNTKICIRC